MTSNKANADRTASRQAKILDVVGEMLMENRLAAATTLDIAKATGMSKRDLYAAYASKDAMVAAVIAERVDHFAQAFRFEPVTNRTDFDRVLKSFSAQFLTFLLSAKAVPLYRLAIADAQAPQRTPKDAAPLGRILVHDGIARTSDAVRAYFISAETAGILKVTNIEAALGAYFGAMIGPLQMRVLLDPTATVMPDEIDRHVRLALMVLHALEALDRTQGQARGQAQSPSRT